MTVETAQNIYAGLVAFFLIILLTDLIAPMLRHHRTSSDDGKRGRGKDTSKMDANQDSDGGLFTFLFGWWAAGEPGGHDHDAREGEVSEDNELSYTSDGNETSKHDDSTHDLDSHSDSDFDSDSYDDD